MSRTRYRRWLSRLAQVGALAGFLGGLTYATFPYFRNHKATPKMLELASNEKIEETIGPEDRGRTRVMYAKYRAGQGEKPAKFDISSGRVSYFDMHTKEWKSFSLRRYISTLHEVRELLPLYENLSLSILVSNQVSEKRRAFFSTPYKYPGLAITYETKARASGKMAANTWLETQIESGVLHDSLTRSSEFYSKLSASDRVELETVFSHLSSRALTRLTQLVDAQNEHAERTRKKTSYVAGLLGALMGAYIVFHREQKQKRFH